MIPCTLLSNRTPSACMVSRRLCATTFNNGAVDAARGVPLLLVRPASSAATHQHKPHLHKRNETTSAPSKFVGGFRSDCGLLEFPIVARGVCVRRCWLCEAEHCCDGTSPLDGIVASRLLGYPHERSTIAQELPTHHNCYLCAQLETRRMAWDTPVHSEPHVLVPRRQCRIARTRHCTVGGSIVVYFSRIGPFATLGRIGVWVAPRPCRSCVQHHQPWRDAHECLFLSGILVLCIGCNTTNNNHIFFSFLLVFSANHDPNSHCPMGMHGMQSLVQRTRSHHPHGVGVFRLHSTIRFPPSFAP